MITIPLRLIRCDAPQRPATAWLIPGTSSAEWLAEIACWPISHAGLKAVALSTSPGSAADGLLVLLNAPLPESCRPHGCHPYGEIAPRLYGPVEAVLSMAVNSADWEQLLPDRSRITVWLPSGVSLGFDPDEVLRVADLLTVERGQESHWNAAVEGPTFVTRLRSVTSAAPVLDLTDLTETWTHEVGELLPPQKIPALADEPPLHWTERLANFTAGFRRWLGGTPASEPGQRLKPSQAWWSRIVTGLLIAWFTLAILWLASVFWTGTTISLPYFLLGLALGCLLLGVLWPFLPRRDSERASPPPATPTGPSRAPTFWDRLIQRIRSGWRSSTGFSPFAEADRRQREREIQRLLRMLDQNPEEGLRYAIPYGGEASRGVAPPSNQLLARDLDFTLSDGCGPADFWELSAEHQQRLVTSYRTLAEREQRRGRHRRAAYIYSRLLDDWRSAALALAAGHYHAEAATIYDQRLKNRAEAARQYELAGQPERALTIYTELSDWLAAAELCLRLERPDDARGFYRRAVDEALASGQIPRASQLLEDKLDAVDEALACLHDAWPAASCAEACFDTWFDMTARHQRTDAAVARLATLQAETDHTGLLKLLPRLERLMKTSPQPVIVDRSREATWALVARGLEEGEPQTARHFTAFLPSLVPNDRLLPRDAHRYVERQQAAASPPRTITRRAWKLQLRHRFTLPETVLSQSVFATALGWVVLTEQSESRSQHAYLTSWEKVAGRRMIYRPRAAATMLAVDASNYSIWINANELKQLTVTGPGDGSEWVITTPKWLPERTQRVLKGSPSTVALWSDEFGHSLSHYLADGSPVRTHRVGEEIAGMLSDEARLPGSGVLQRCGDQSILVALPVQGDMLHGELYDHQQIRIWSAMLACTDICCSPTPGSRAALLLGRETVLMTDDLCVRHPQDAVLENWQSPRGTYLLGGSFCALVDGERLALYDTATKALLVEHAASAAPPLAITGCGAGALSVVRVDGTIEVWAFDRS